MLGLAPSSCLLVGNGGEGGRLGVAAELDDGIAFDAGDCGRDFDAGGRGFGLALAPTLSLRGRRSTFGFSIGSSA